MMFEELMYDNKDGPASAQMWDMIQLSHGGRVWSGAEMVQLLEQNGFKNVKVAYTKGEYKYDAILATKA